MPAASIRARVRAEMIDEIKATARRHLATDGANLSLRAVARDMGMVSSALYRYFASRDDLLTALILDAYNALGDAVEHADGTVADRTDVRGRWLAICHAIRDWALANPAEYALIFGSPVPGYAAPQATAVAAARTPVAMLRVLADGAGRSALSDLAAGEVPEPVLRDIRRVSQEMFPELSVALFARGSIGWVHVFGAISFELFGQLNNVIEDRHAYFDYQMRALADLIGL